MPKFCPTCDGSLDTVGLCGNPQCLTNKIAANYLQVDLQSFVPAQLGGWICPRCLKVNAPFVRHCDCTPKSSDAPTITTYTGEGDIPICPNCNDPMEFDEARDMWISECGYEMPDHGDHWDREDSR